MQLYVSKLMESKDKHVYLCIVHVYLTHGQFNSLNIGGESPFVSVQLFMQ